MYGLQLHNLSEVDMCTFQGQNILWHWKVAQNQKLPSERLQTKLIDREPRCLNSSGRDGWSGSLKKGAEMCLKLKIENHAQIFLQRQKEIYVETQVKSHLKAMSNLRKDASLGGY